MIATEPPVGPPRARRSTWRADLLIFVIGPLVGVFEVIGFLAYDRTVHAPPDIQALSWTFFNNAVCGLFLPLVRRWCERRPWRSGGALRQLPYHLAGALAFSLGVATTIGVVRWGAYLALGATELSARALVGKIVSGWLLFDFIVYAVILGVVSAIAYHRELNATELDAARLATALAETELKLLKAELDPHFIFNALHTVSSLIHSDPESADLMVCRISDFLRLCLASRGAQEVTLQEELEHLQSYMDIQIVRFRGRLTLDVDVALPLLSCRVPNLLLQPLIENVVKHAVARTRRNVHASVSARRAGETLVLEIADDGPGLAPESVTAPRRQGIGVTNTRSRLAKLYGDAHSLTLENRARGGMRAVVVLPWRLEDRTDPRPSNLNLIEEPEDDPGIANAHR